MSKYPKETGAIRAMAFTKGNNNSDYCTITFCLEVADLKIVLFV